MPKNPSLKLNTFSKEERLCSKILIGKLFKEGNTFTEPPFRITWLKTDIKQDFPCQILISVPTHKMPRAVDRNKIKRQIREAFRKNKHSFYEFLNVKNSKIILGILYNSKELHPYTIIESKIILILQRFKKVYEMDAK